MGDETTCITLAKFTTQRDWLRREIQTINCDCAIRFSLSLILDSVNNLLEVYQREGLQTTILHTIQMMRSKVVLSQDALLMSMWHSSISLWVMLEETHLDLETLGMWELQHMYDRFIGA